MITGLYGTANTGNENQTNYHIYFYENCTFSLAIGLNGEGSPVSYVGNYQINENNIVLNYWMYLASNYKNKSDITKNIETTSTIILNEDGTIKLNNIPGNDKNITLNLKKITGNEEQKLISTKVFDIPYLINNMIERLSL